jgi:hypothetical protein
MILVCDNYTTYYLLPTSLSFIFLSFISPHLTSPHPSPLPLPLSLSLSLSLYLSLSLSLSTQINSLQQHLLSLVLMRVIL